jgi:hypothetical protein
VFVYVCVSVCIYVCMCVDICVCVYVFIQDPDPTPDPDPGSDPELSEKSDPDPGSDPKKIIPDPQHCFFNIKKKLFQKFSSSFSSEHRRGLCVCHADPTVLVQVRTCSVHHPSHFRYCTGTVFERPKVEKCNFI